MHRVSFLGWGIAALVTGAAFGAVPERGVERVVASVDAAFRITSVRTDDPPVIDGRLDDAAWQAADAIDNFRQVQPVEDSEPSQRTVVRLLHDDDFLYIAFRCFDDRPEEIIGTEMRRDGSLFRDDRCAVVLDTFLDRRNAYFFEMNPVGGRTDALVENNDNFRTDWDAIWYGRATIDEQGWVAEMAIPFKTVNFNPASDTWGINFSRSIRRKNEDIRWSAPFQNRSLRHISDAGVVSGLTGLDQGIGLDFKPFGTASYLQNHNDDDSDFDFDAGFDLTYNLSPSLKGALTVNTDFAETEVDQRRVNLTRFPLFFPEKRDFFLQDAGIFEFGGVERSPLPFFSRRIGIGGDGRPADILAGMKLTGRVNDLNIGLLDVQQDAHNGIEEKNLATGRVSYNVGGESELGMIFTNGDPLTNGSNTLVGGDFNFRDSTVDGDKIITSHTWFLQSKTTGAEGGESAYGFKIDYPNDRFSLGFGFDHIDQDFNPALGWAPRRGIRNYGLSGRYRWRPEHDIRRIDTGVRSTLITNLDNDLESSFTRFDLLSLETEYGDRLGLQFELAKEALDESFEISEGIVLPVDTYDWDRWTFWYSGSQARTLRWHFGTSYGGFWSGTRWGIQAIGEWRASANMFLGFQYDQSEIKLDEGDFTTRVGSFRVNFFFTPDISWMTYIQFDNASDTLGLHSRLRWIFEPGNELFLVVNQGYDIIDSHLHSGFTEVTSKVGWTFRF